MSKELFFELYWLLRNKIDSLRDELRDTQDTITGLRALGAPESQLKPHIKRFAQLNVDICHTQRMLKELQEVGYED